LIFTLRLTIQLQLEPVGTPLARSTPPAPEEVGIAEVLKHAVTHLPSEKLNAFTISPAQ
jgi:hypothetical protein